MNRCAPFRQMPLREIIFSLIAFILLSLGSCQTPLPVELKGNNKIFELGNNRDQEEAPLKETGVYFTSKGKIAAPGVDNFSDAIVGITHFVYLNDSKVDSGTYAVVLFNDTEVKFNDAFGISVGYSGKDLGNVAINRWQLAKKSHYVKIPGIAGEGSPKGYYYSLEPFPFEPGKNDTLYQNTVKFSSENWIQTPSTLITNISIKPNSGDTIVRENDLVIKCDAPSTLYLTISSIDSSGNLLISIDRRKIQFEGGQYTLSSLDLSQLPANQQFLFTFVSPNVSVKVPSEGYSRSVLFYAADVYSIMVKINSISQKP
ncbi:MAG: hypothetical protein ACP5ON_01125 [Bacteroidota bacterium]